MNWKHWAIVGGACYLPTIAILAFSLSNPLILFFGIALPGLAVAGAVAVAIIVNY